MLVLLDVKIEPLNVRKNKKTFECDKVRSHVMLVLHNVTMKLSNVKNKIMVSLNLTKVQLDVIFQ